MTDISLLPEDMRGKEEEKETIKPAKEEVQAGGLTMHVPDVEIDEDIEIIEVDEGDLAAVLSEEPFMTRMTYKLAAGIDKLKDKFFKKTEEVPPAKLPPQFFKPPKSGLVTKAPAVVPPGGKLGQPVPGGAPSHGKPRARIIPQEGVPRRVRVIRRVKRPVRVSLISAEELASLSINVGKRKMTFGIVTILFVLAVVGVHMLISQRVEGARQQLSDIEMQLGETKTTSKTRKETWSQYEDLQDRLTLLDDLLNQHVVISRIFDFLEFRTLPSVAYRTATWSSEGDLILDVVADSFDSAARQLVAFEQSETVRHVEATSFTAQEADNNGGDSGASVVSFQLIVELDPSGLRGPLFLEDEEDEPEEGGEMIEDTETLDVMSDL